MDPPVCEEPHPRKLQVQDDVRTSIMKSFGVKFGFARSW